jgi:rubrerythrin
MSIKFNADEALRMAVRIEENGAKFYRKAASLRPKGETENVAMLKRLAAMEEGHKAIFTAMRRRLKAELKGETAFDPYLEANLYLNAMADMHGGEGSPLRAASLTGKETMEDIVYKAVCLEEKSIVFYVGLIDMVPPELGRDEIGQVIGEEKRHLADLAAELKKIRGA